MNWIQETFLQPTMIQTVAVICIVCAIGVYLGKLKYKGVSLGITFVFFTGILVSHFGVVVNSDMLAFAQNFGLIVFVYTLGLQVGPGFFSSLKKGGVLLNSAGLAVIFIGLIMTILLHYLTGISVSDMMGLLCGAANNTPSLGAAQEAMLQINSTDEKSITDMALACAVAYPMGVIGVILAIIVLIALKSPVLIICGFVPVFFDNATIGVFANEKGGLKAVLILPFISGLCQVFGSALIAGWVGMAAYGGYLGMWDWAVVWPVFTVVMKYLSYIGVALIFIGLLAIPQIQYYKDKKGYFLMTEDYEAYKELKANKAN